jgi:hypothetical protein
LTIQSAPSTIHLVRGDSNCIDPNTALSHHEDPRNAWRAHAVQNEEVFIAYGACLHDGHIAMWVPRLPLTPAQMARLASLPSIYLLAAILIVAIRGKF